MEQGRESVEQRNTSTTQQGNSKEASPSTQPEERPLSIVFSPEEEAEFRSEIHRLTQLSVICRMVGARPNRGECKDLLQDSMKGLIGRIRDVQFMGSGFYHVELDTMEAVEMMLAHSPLDVRGARAFVMPWKQGFDPKEAARKGDRIFPLTIVFPGLRKEYLPMLVAIASRIGTVMDLKENMAARLSKMSGFPSARILVGSLENLPTRIILPNSEGEYIEKKVEFAGIPGQCFYCRQMGHLAKDCPRRKVKSNEEKRRCDYCKKHGHEVDNCQEKVTTECMGTCTQKGKEKVEGQWIGVKANYGCKSGTMVPQETCLTQNIYNVLNVEDDMQEKLAPTIDAVRNNVATTQTNDACATHIREVIDQVTPTINKLNQSMFLRDESICSEDGVDALVQPNTTAKASKRTLRSRTLDNAVTIRTCVMSRKDVGSAGFSILDYAAPFGHDFTKHLGINIDHDPITIRIHVLLKQKELDKPFIGYSFPLCGYEKNVWNYPDVMLVKRGQVLQFSKYVQCPHLGEALLKGLEKASFSLIPYLDAMNRRHVVVDVPSDAALDFGYVYIHEEGVPESQAKARGHHNWSFIKEGCDRLKGVVLNIGDEGNVSFLEPSSKTRRTEFGLTSSSSQ